MNDSSKATCCSCIPIRTGVWILLILGMIGAVWDVVQGGLYFGGKESLEDLREEWKWSDGDLVLKDKTLLALGRTNNGMGLGFGLIQLLLSILLILGLSTHSPAKVRVWVKVNLGLWVLDAFASYIFAIVIMSVVGFGFGFVAFTVVTLVLVFEGYYIYVVHTYAGIMEGEIGGGVGGVAYESVAGKP